MRRPTSQHERAAVDTLVVVRRGACEHRCPVYNLVIFSDGSFLFDGRAYVRRLGVTKGSIPLEALAELSEAATRLRFFDLPAAVGIATGGGDPACTSIRSDRPQVVVSISTGGQSHTVRHDQRCVSETSERLTQFEDRIDQVVGTARFR